VDIIEAGFPCASPDDLNAVRQIAQTVGNDIDESRYGYVATHSLIHSLSLSLRRSLTTVEAVVVLPSDGAL